MKSLGIDLGTDAALACVELAAGRYRLLANVAIPSAGKLDVRLERLDAMLEVWLADHRPDVVATEQTFIAATGDQRRNAAKSQIGLQTVVRLACRRHGVRYEPLAANTIKLCVAGHGRADKERVGRAVVSRYGVGVGTSEHMRDAVAIAHTALVRLETERKLAAQGVLAVGKGKGKRARAATP